MTAWKDIRKPRKRKAYPWEIDAGPRNAVRKAWEEFLERMENTSPIAVDKERSIRVHIMVCIKVFKERALEPELIELFVRALVKFRKASVDWAFQEWLEHGKPFFPRPCEIVSFSERWERENPPAKCGFCGVDIEMGKRACGQTCADKIRAVRARVAVSGS